MTTPLERTARRIVWGTWGCAAIVMAASAANAALTYGAIGDNRALGLATGIAVDIALCVVLIGERQLYVRGESSTWGRALRLITATMSLILNTGISLRDGHYFAALLHSFLPVLLIGLTEYAQEVLLKFAALTREAERAPLISDPDRTEPCSGGLSAAGSDQHNAPLGSYSGGRPAERAVTVLPVRSGPDLAESPLRAGLISPVRPPSLGPARLPGAGRPVVATNGATTPATNALPRRDKPATTGTTKHATRTRQAKSATAEQRRAWVRQQRDNGRTISGADVHKQFPGTPRDGARIVRQVATELDEELRAVAAGERS